MIDSELALWLEDFLRDRKQRVVLGNSVFSWKSVLSEVPQDSVLEPSLVVLYINDLPELVTYADDSRR